MPMLRRFGGTKSLRVAEYTGAPLTTTSPETGDGAHGGGFAAAAGAEQGEEPTLGHVEAHVVNSLDGATGRIDVLGKKIFDFKHGVFRIP